MSSLSTDMSFAQAPRRPACAREGLPEGIPGRLRMRPQRFTPLSNPLRALTLAVAILAVSAPTRALATPRNSIDAAVVDAAAKELMDRYGIPGIAIGLSVDGAHSFYSYGLASKTSETPVDQDTLFELGSISKTFTATLATYAQAQGKLSLEDPVGTVLPDLSAHPIGRAPLWQLAVHTAGGFPLQFPATVKSDADAMDYYTRWKPSYAPGERRSYANPSIALLGVAAAHALDMPFRSALQDVLFPKLGLKSTWLDVPPDQQLHYAQGYTAKDAPVRLNAGPLAAEAYGVRSSARDLLRFVDLNIAPETGDPALNQALVDAQGPVYEVGPMTQALIWERYRYPLALEALLEGNSPRMSYRDNRITPIAASLLPQKDWLYNKTGGTGGFASYIAFIPSTRIAVVILTNKTHPSEGRVRLAYTLLQALAAKP